MKDINFHASTRRGTRLGRRLGTWAVAWFTCTALAQPIDIQAIVVADAHLPIGVRGDTIAVTPIASLSSKYLSALEAEALSQGVLNYTVQICHELGLKAPGPAYVFVDDTERPGFSAVDGTLPKSHWPTPHFGVIVLGASFAGRLATDGTTSVNGFGVAVAVAHELAHIYQFRTGVWRRLLAIEGNLSRRRAELHADFLAGWLSARLGFKKLDDIDAKARRIFELGDQEVLDPNHHGTPGQRYSAMLRGFFLGVSQPQLMVNTVSMIGEEFINGLLPLPQER